MYQILSLLKNKGKTQFSIQALDRYMQNAGKQQFTYDSFKAVYDSDPKIKAIVKDFDQETITLKTSEMDDINPSRSGSTNKVSQMAKRAVDL